MADTSDNSTASQGTPRGPAGNGSRSGSALNLVASVRAAGPRSRVLMLILLANGVLAVATGVVVYHIWKSSRPVESPTARVEVTSRPANPTVPTRRETPLVEPLSWRQAELAFSKGEYATALQRYQALLEHYRTLPAEELACDFFTFRLAHCLVQTNDLRAAGQFYQSIEDSRSPLVGAAASYQLGVMDLLEGRFFEARRQAYRALARLGPGNEKTLAADCDYLAARAASAKVYALSGVEGRLGWRPIPQADPFAGLDEPLLRQRLEQRALGDAQSALGPRVQVDRGQYSLQATRAPLEEVLAAVVRATGQELRWQNVGPAARQRAVSLDLTSANEQRLCEVAGGCGGLVVSFSGKSVVVSDVESVESLSQQRATLAREAKACWRRFALRYDDDRRLSQVHFALGVLSESMGEPADAIAEYQQMARRYSHDRQAPEALLRAAGLRIAMKDYAAARATLKDLIELYNDFPRLDQAYLAMAQACSQSNQHKQAAEVYSKLYYLNLGDEAKSAAALGAGLEYSRCGQNEQAVKWLARYSGTRSQDTAEQARAQLTLGQASRACGKLAVAETALKTALYKGGDSEVAKEAALELAEVQLEQDRPGAALASLKRLDAQDLTPAQRCRQGERMMHVYRAMGMSDKAIVMGRRAIAAAPVDGQAPLYMELARCYADEGDLASAQSAMAQGVAVAQGQTYQAGTIELAELYARDNRPSQAVAILEQLLKGKLDEAHTQQAVALLSKAYTAQKNYEKAAAVYGMLGKEGK